MGVGRESDIHELATVRRQVVDVVAVHDRHVLEGVERALVERSHADVRERRQVVEGKEGKLATVWCDLDWFATVEEVLLHERRLGTAGEWDRTDLGRGRRPVVRAPAKE